MTHRTDTVCFDCAACRSRHASIREACEARRDARDATRIEDSGYPAWIVSYVSCDGRGLPYSVGFEARSDAESFAAEQSEVRFHNADVSVRAGFVSQHGRVLASAVAADAISEERPRDAA